MLWILFLFIFPEVRSNPPLEFFKMWEKSQVILYRLKNLENVGTSKNAKIEAVGNCFGTLISDKHVLTKANCVLEKKGDARKVNKKDQYIVSLVHYHLEVQANPKKSCTKKDNAISSIYGKNGIIS